MRAQVLVAKARGLALVEQIVVFPEFALRLGGPGGDGGVDRFPTPVGEIPPFDPQRPVLDVLIVELRFHLTGELAAEQSLVVPVLDQYHGRIRRPQGRVTELASSGLSGSAGILRFLLGRGRGHRSLLAF